MRERSWFSVPHRGQPCGASAVQASAEVVLLVRAAEVVLQALLVGLAHAADSFFLLFRARLRAARRFIARLSSSDRPPQTPDSWPDSSAH